MNNFDITVETKREDKINPPIWNELTEEGRIKRHGEACYQRGKDDLREEIEKKIKDSLEKCEYCNAVVGVDCQHYDNFGNEALQKILKII